MKLVPLGDKVVLKQQNQVSYYQVRHRKSHSRLKLLQ